MAHRDTRSRAQLLKQLDTEVHSSPWANEDRGVIALTAHAHDEEWARSHGPQAATSAGACTQLTAGASSSSGGQRVAGPPRRAISGAGHGAGRGDRGDGGARPSAASGQGRGQLERRNSRLLAEGARERGKHGGDESERIFDREAEIQEVRDTLGQSNASTQAASAATAATDGGLATAAAVPPQLSPHVRRLWQKAVFANALDGDRMKSRSSAKIPSTSCANMNSGSRGGWGGKSGTGDRFKTVVLQASGLNHSQAFKAHVKPKGYNPLFVHLPGGGPTHAGEPEGLKEGVQVVVVNLPAPLAKYNNTTGAVIKTELEEKTNVNLVYVKLPDHLRVLPIVCPSECVHIRKHPKSSQRVRPSREQNGEEPSPSVMKHASSLILNTEFVEDVLELDFGDGEVSGSEIESHFGDGEDSGSENQSEFGAPTSKQTETETEGSEESSTTKSEIAFHATEVLFSGHAEGSDYQGGEDRLGERSVEGRPDGDKQLKQKGDFHHSCVPTTEEVFRKLVPPSPLMPLASRPPTAQGSKSRRSPQPGSNADTIPPLSSTFLSSRPSTSEGPRSPSPPARENGAKLDGIHGRIALAMTEGRIDTDKSDVRSFLAQEIVANSQTVSMTEAVETRIVTSCVSTDMLIAPRPAKSAGWIPPTERRKKRCQQQQINCKPQPNALPAHLQRKFSDADFNQQHAIHGQGDRWVAKQVGKEINEQLGSMVMSNKLSLTLTLRPATSPLSDSFARGRSPIRDERHFGGGEPDVWVADESPVGEDDTETGGGEEMIMASPAWGDGQDVSLDFPRSVSQPVPHLSSFSRPTTRSTSREPTSNWSRPRTSEGVMMGNPMGVGSVREYVGKLEQHGRRLSPDAKEMAVTAVAGDSTHAHARTSGSGGQSRASSAKSQARFQRAKSTPPPKFEWKQGVGLVEAREFQKNQAAPPNWPPPPPKMVVSKQAKVTWKQQQLMRTGSAVFHSEDRRRYPYFAAVNVVSQTCPHRFPPRPLGGEWQLIDTLKTEVEFREPAGSARTDVILNKDYPRVPHSRLHKELRSRPGGGKNNASLMMGTKLGKELRQQSSVLPLAEDLPANSAPTISVHT